MFFELADPIRYSFEQKFLPESLFKYKKDFITSIVTKPDLLWTILRDMYKGNNSTIPYEKDEIFIEPFNIEQSFYGVKVNFPTPETPTLSYCAYIVYDSSFSNVSYFCVEKMAGIDGSVKKCLCSINENKVRANYGEINTDVGADLDKAIEIYLASYEASSSDDMTSILVCMSGMLVQNLPSLFYDDVKKFIVTTIAHSEIVYDVTNKSLESVGFVCPYTKEDIVINAGRINDTLRCSTITFKNQLLEYRYEVICLFDMNFKNPMYFISVRDTAMDEETAALIYIDNTFKFIELEKVQPDLEIIIGKCVDEYEKKYN